MEASRAKRFGKRTWNRIITENAGGKQSRAHRGGWARRGIKSTGRSVDRLPLGNIRGIKAERGSEENLGSTVTGLHHLKVTKTSGAEGFANRSGEALNAIINVSRQMDRSAGDLVAVVDSVSAVVEQNTAATEQMTASSIEIREVIENIASISEENSTSVEEVSVSAEAMAAQVDMVQAAAQALFEMAENLQQAVQHFKLLGQGEEPANDGLGE